MGIRLLLSEGVSSLVEVMHIVFVAASCKILLGCCTGLINLPKVASDLRGLGLSAGLGFMLLKSAGPRVATLASFLTLRACL